MEWGANKVYRNQVLKYIIFEWLKFTVVWTAVMILAPRYIFYSNPNAYISFPVAILISGIFSAIGSLISYWNIKNNSIPDKSRFDHFFKKLVFFLILFVVVSYFVKKTQEPNPLISSPLNSTVEKFGAGIPPPP